MVEQRTYYRTNKFDLTGTAEFFFVGLGGGMGGGGRRGWPPGGARSLRSTKNHIACKFECNFLRNSAVFTFISFDFDYVFFVFFGYFI